MADKKIKLPEELIAQALAPQEQMLAVATKQSKLTIGIPKENTFQENRISLTPGSVEVLTARGHNIMVETKAGEGAKIYDTDFSEARAEIVENHDDIFKCDIIIKSAPLTDE